MFFSIFKVYFMKSLALMSLLSLTSLSVLAESNLYKVTTGATGLDILAYSTGENVSEDEVDEAMVLSSQPSSYASTASSVMVAMLGEDIVPMSSCLAYINAGLGSGQDGVYQITNAGSSYPVYCDQTTFGGGFTLVVAQYESSPVAWSGDINGVYDVTLQNNTGFTLASSQIPSHSETGISQESWNGLSVANYFDFIYSTEDIPLQVIEDKDGVFYHVHRNSSYYYAYHDPEGKVRSGDPMWEDSLTIDQVGGRAFTYSFSPNNTEVTMRSYAYSGNDLWLVNVSGGFFVWVR
jgi:hypothetical protein